MADIIRFRHGPKELVDRLNQMIDIINSLNKIRSSTFIGIEKTNYGIAPVLYINKVIEKMLKMSGGGGGGVGVSWAEIIEMPDYGNPPEDNGRAYYTCRLVSDSTAVWVVDTNYYISDEVIGSDNLKYISLTGTEGSPNIGNDPTTDEVNWEQSEEIKIEYAIGTENTDGFDIRDCVPWFEVGEIIPVISRSVESIGSTYYLWQTLTYSGTQEQSTLRYNPENNKKMTQAVFA